MRIVIVEEFIDMELADQNRVVRQDVDDDDSGLGRFGGSDQRWEIPSKKKGVNVAWHGTTMEAFENIVGEGLVLPGVDEGFPPKIFFAKPGASYLDAENVSSQYIQWNHIHSCVFVGPHVCMQVANLACAGSKKHKALRWKSTGSKVQGLACMIRIIVCRLYKLQNYKLRINPVPASKDVSRGQLPVSGRSLICI